MNHGGHFPRSRRWNRERGESSQLDRFHGSVTPPGRSRISLTSATSHSFTQACSAIRIDLWCRNMMSKQTGTCYIIELSVLKPLTPTSSQYSRISSSRRSGLADMSFTFPTQSSYDWVGEVRREWCTSSPPNLYLKTNAKATAWWRRITT